MKHALLMALTLSLPNTQVSYAQPVSCSAASWVSTPCRGLLLPEEDAQEAIEALEVEIPSLEAELRFTKGLLKAKEGTVETLRQAAKMSQEASESMRKSHEALVGHWKGKAEAWHNHWLFKAGLVVGGVALGVGLAL